MLDRRKKNQRKLLMVSAICFLIALLGFSLIGKEKEDLDEGTSTKIYTYDEVFPHVKRLKEFKKIIYSYAGITEKDINNMKNVITEYLGDNINKVSISYYDINSQLGFDINEKVEVRAASTLKVPVSMMLYDEINSKSEKAIKETDTMMYKEQDFEESYGGIGYEDTSKPQTFKHINESMIKYSDNVAVNMLLRHFGNDKRYNYIESIVGHPVNRSGNYTTAEDTMKILKKLHYNPENNPDYPKIIDLMKNTEFHERLDKYLPYDIVAHKIGDFSDSTGNYIHDVGIIYGKRPYILVVLTNNIDDAYDEIANISKIIYDVQNR